MTFDQTWTNAARLALVCCLLSACGGGGGSPQKSGKISPEQRFDIARAAEASGNMVMAKEMYAAAAAETEGDRTMQLRAAQGLARAGAPADGISVLQGVLRRSPGDQDVRRTLGSMQIMNGLPGDAVNTLAQVLKARPEDDTARVNEGVALDMLNRHAEAQQLYREALTRAPGDTEAANDLALSLMLSGQTAAAKVVLAPFRSRGDLPERMRTTMGLVDGAPAEPIPSPASPVVTKPTPPTSLKAPGQPKKPAKVRPTAARGDQTPAR